MTNLFNTLIQYRSTFWIDIPRQVFAWLDSAVYWLISSVYGLIEDLARVQIFQESTLNNFYNKVYLLLSIFMLFKISFSIVNYILDPSKAVDKNGGFGKLFMNIVIMFAMILSAPIAFKYLTKLQNAILDDEIILNFIFGEAGTTTAHNEIQLADPERCDEWSKIHEGMKPYDKSHPGMSTANNNGDYLAVTIYRVFYSLADTKVTNKEMDSKNGTLDVKKGRFVFDYMCNEDNKNISVSDMATFVNAYVDEANEAGSNGYYIIEYKFFVATAVGVFALLMLINIAFETSVRAIKLGFYQLIAPIPIISYIDPNSSKNGMFSKYIKALGKTWASLFIRLFSFYFAVFVIKEFNTNFVDDLGELHSSKFFVTLFVIIGALMFAKQLPQLIEELFPGMKMGKMQLNPFKNIAENALGGKQLFGAGGAVVGLGIGAVSRLGNLAKNKIEKFKENNDLESRNERRLDRINDRANRQIDRYDNRMEKYRNKLDGLDENSKKYARYAKKYYNAYDKSKKSFDKNNEEYAKVKAQNDRRVERRDRMQDMKNRVNDFFENNKVGKGLVTAKNVVVQSGTIISQAMTAAGMGYKEASNLKFSIHKIGHESARIRNYKDEYGVLDRVKDRATDFFGIRGTSGTSSEVANRITELTKDLNRINQSIRVMSNSLAEEINKIGAGAQNMVSFDPSNGRPVINTAYTPSNAREQSVYNNITYFANQLNAAYDNQAAKEKELKIQEKIKSMPGDLKR